MICKETAENLGKPTLILEVRYLKKLAMYHRLHGEPVNIDEIKARILEIEAELKRRGL